MLKVYRIHTDADRYQSLRLADPAQEGSILMDCKPKLESWIPPEVYIPYPMRTQPDFYYLNIQGALVTGPRAVNRLSDFFEFAGEILPLPHEEESFSLINILNCLNCLDKAKTTWRPYSLGTKGSPSKYVFHPERFHGMPGLFKIPETHQREVLIWVNTDDVLDNDFLFRTDFAELKGLTFSKLWQGER